MKKGTTTPLPPYSTTGVSPMFNELVDLIDYAWAMIDKYEKEYQVNPSVDLDKQIYYFYNLSEYWEGIYLILMGKRFNEDFFEG
jgi:hypothetical protein